MGAKDNFNQAMHEVFPFYRYSKSSVVEDESEADFSASMAVQESNKIKSFLVESNNTPDIESIIPEVKAENMETTYITKGTKITGTVVTETNIDIKGEIIGDIESQNSIKVSGKIEGNLTGKNIEVNNATIKGNIHSADSLKIVAQSSVVGNISADELEFNSKINGNLNVKRGITIRKDSHVTGDITAISICIEKGAVVKGMVSVLGE